jgi:hypothetical protein
VNLRTRKRIPKVSRIFETCAAQLWDVVGFVAKHGQYVRLKMQKADPIAFARDMVAANVRLRGRHWRLADGLYRVTTRKARWPSRTGGFLVYKGKVRRCSPSLRRKIHVYAHMAEYWGVPW